MDVGICVDMGVVGLYGMVGVGVGAIVGVSVCVWFLVGGCVCICMDVGVLVDCIVWLWWV